MFVWEICFWVLLVDLLQFQVWLSFKLMRNGPTQTTRDFMANRGTQNLTFEKYMLVRKKSFSMRTFNWVKDMHS